MSLKGILLGAGVLAMMAGTFYSAGYEVARARFESEATSAAQRVEDAVQRASHALAELSAQLETLEQNDEEKMREIEDAASADGAVCNVPVDRLRALDSIGG